MAYKDRTGIKYGYLTARKYLGKSKWLCDCDCGNTKIVYGGHLESGHTKSCGCQHFQSRPRHEITGQKFGRLTVLFWAQNGKWHCKCDCGNEVDVITYNLESGNTQSCGCLQKERTSEAAFVSLSGQRFGKLTVVERVKNNRFNHTCYKCKCDCGGITIVDAANLRNGNTSSCGCIKSKGEMLINQWLSARNIPFVAQYSFDDIKLSTGRRPFYDFAIFDNNNNLTMIIEYNGKQHYEYSGYGWDTQENYLATVRRDLEKRQALLDKNVPLKIISYQDNINEKLFEIFNL